MCPGLTRRRAVAVVGLVAFVVLAISCFAVRHFKGNVLGLAIADEVGHLATGLLVLLALAPQATMAFWAGLLGASVLIDLDHIPDMLGSDWLTRGTPRPYPHSLSTIVVVLVVAALVKGRLRSALFGVALGLAAHFVRDLAEGSTGVSLLWPITPAQQRLPLAAYLVLALVLVLIAIARAGRSPSQTILASAPHESGASRERSLYRSSQKEKDMTDGGIDETKGRAKEAAGSLTNDQSLKNEGKVDKATGSIKDKVGGAADKVKDVVNPRN
jgi:uncharacterized protein YjbJ (UPF0337 family)